MKINLTSKYKTYTLLFFVLSIFNNIFGQESTAVVEPTSKTIKKIAIGLNTGTKAFVGLDAAMNINRYFNARLSLNYANFRFVNDNYTPPVEELKDQQFHFEFDYLQSNIELLGEYMPFGSAFRIVGGFGIFPKNKISMYGIANKSYLYNDVEIDPEEIGGGRGTWTYKSPVSPYLGLAFGRAIPKKKLGFSVELGTYYKGKPDIEIEANGSLRENYRNEPYLERNLSQFKFIPSLSMRLAYKIN